MYRRQKPFSVMVVPERTPREGPSKVSDKMRGKRREAVASMQEDVEAQQEVIHLSPATARSISFAITAILLMAVGGFLYHGLV